MRSKDLSQHIDDNVRIDTQDPGGFTIPLLEELPAANMCDPVVEAYKKDVDRTLLRENLELTVAERMLKFQDFMEFVEQVRSSGRTENDRSNSTE